THDYYRVLQRLVARLDDAHTNVYLPRALGAMERTPGLTTRLIEDRVIVVRVDGGGAADAGVKIGMEITAVDGIAVKAYAAEHVAPFVCASSPQDRISRTYGSQLLRGPLRERVRLKVRDTGGSESELEVPRESRMAVGMRRFSQPAFRFEVLADNLGYVRLDSFGSEKVREQFAAAFEKIRATDALVIDLRHNGGGNSRVGWEIMAHLTKEPFATLRWHTLQYRPTMRAWGRQPVTRYARGPSRFAYDAVAIYDRPVAMLIGPRTFSAAEDMAAVFDQLDRGPLIGEATGGSSGQPLMFDLPGGGRARVCTKHDYYADGTEFIGVGIRPDLVVKPTIADVRAGVDTVLQAAIRRLQESGR
ncbi:MAG: S41 family peptidase, partial [bacterium]|nr:S41 family peptidase [bacterium]